jgi:hypothetical protein
MDAQASYPLVCRPPEHGALLPASSVLDAQCHSEADLLALLWRRFCQLAWLFFLALLLLRRCRRQLVELRLQANYYRSQHRRAVQRAADLTEQVQRLQGEIRELERRLYGRKSETAAATKPATKPASPANHNHGNDNNGKARARGQQPGSQGHGRRQHEHLPTSHENISLPKDQQCCAACGEPFEEIPGSADGDILEIDVRAHRRRYHRQRYRRG